MVLSNSLKVFQFIGIIEIEREIQTLIIKIIQTLNIMSNVDKYAFTIFSLPENVLRGANS